MVLARKSASDFDPVNSSTPVTLWLLQVNKRGDLGAVQLYSNSR